MKKKKLYKKYRGEWWKRAAEYEYGNAPLALIVELVSTCNLACSMCFTITDKFQNAVTGATRMMPWSQYIKIIDDAKASGVYSICISWRGEATLYRVKDENGDIRTFGDAIKYACSKNFLEVTSLTHGQNLTDQLIDDIVEAKPNWISFSIDGLEDEYNKHFDLKTISPYMLLVAKSKKPNIIPSAIHIDGTARVQTVSKIQNKKFYNLIKAFHKITKVPILLNTSFNDAGEPLVETPLDALLCFLKTKIDYLIIEDKLIYRPKNSKKIIKKLENFRNKLINDKEKLLLKKFMKSFSHKEFLIRRKNENKLAIYEAIYNPSKIFCTILERYKNKKILLIGTNDHTAALIKTHKNKLQNRGIDYFELPFNDFLKSKNKIEFLNSVTKIDNNYDAIIISSFEYMEKIKETISPHYSNKQILSLYNNRSRSIVDTHLINKNKNKKNIYKNGIYQKL